MVSLHTSPIDDAGSGDVGGMNVVVLHTALALAGLGCTVEMLTRRTSPTQASTVAVAPGVLLHRLQAGPAEVCVKGDNEAFIPEFSSRLAGLPPYDILHAHHWFSGMAALPVASEQHVPLVQSFHSIAADPGTPLSEGERPESPGRLAGEALLATRCAGVIAVSEAARDTAIHRLGAAAANVWTVPPGVDAALFRPAQADDTTPVPGDYVAIAARLEPLKGIDVAIRMLAALPVAHRPVLVISGGPTSGYEDYPAALRSLAQEEGVGESVRFLGPLSRERLARLLRHARALIVPSHSETFGLIALEAQASGVPVVAARAGGLVEAVADHRTGVLIDDHDPAHWAEVVQDLLRSPRRRARLGVAGRSRALAFTWERTARGTLACYDRVLTGAWR